MKAITAVFLTIIFLILGFLGVAKDVSRVRKMIRERPGLGFAALIEIILFGCWGGLGLLSFVLAIFFLIGACESHHRRGPAIAPTNPIISPLKKKSDQRMGQMTKGNGAGGTRKCLQGIGNI